MAEEETRIPTDAELRTAMFTVLERLAIHTEANTQFLNDLQARVAGNWGIAAIVDENEANAQLARDVAARKELISHLFDKSHQYVTVIVAGAYTAYFATLGTLASRFTDGELRISALLMTISLTVFIGWEVFNMFYIGHHTFKGDYGTLQSPSQAVKRAWYVVLSLTLCTAIPAIGLSLWVYLRGLGVGQIFYGWF